MEMRISQFLVFLNARFKDFPFILEKIGRRAPGRKPIIAAAAPISPNAAP